MKVAGAEPGGAVCTASGLLVKYVLPGAWHTSSTGSQRAAAGDISASSLSPMNFGTATTGTNTVSSKVPPWSLSLWPPPPKSHRDFVIEEFTEYADQQTEHEERAGLVWLALGIRALEYWRLGVDQCRKSEDPRLVPP